MLSCNEATRLISESQDRKLPLVKRISLRFHLLMCFLCRRFEKQTKAINKLLKREISSDLVDLAGKEKPEQLSQEVRERLKTALRDNQK